MVNIVSNVRLDFSNPAEILGYLVVCPLFSSCYCKGLEFWACEELRQGVVVVDMVLFYYYGYWVLRFKKARFGQCPFLRFLTLVIKFVQSLNSFNSGAHKLQSPSIETNLFRSKHNDISFGNFGIVISVTRLSCVQFSMLWS